MYKSLFDYSLDHTYRFPHLAYLFKIYMNNFNTSVLSMHIDFLGKILSPNVAFLSLRLNFIGFLCKVSSFANVFFEMNMRAYDKLFSLTIKMTCQILIYSSTLRKITHIPLNLAFIERQIMVSFMNYDHWFSCKKTW